MKGGSTILLVLLAVVVMVLGYFNFEQQKTIQVLNDEILEQARLRHNLILKKHVLEQQLETLAQDSVKTPVEERLSLQSQE